MSEQDFKFLELARDYEDTKIEYEKLNKIDHPDYLAVCNWLEKNRTKIEKEKMKGVFNGRP